VTEDVSVRLREQGLNVTAQRLALLRAVAAGPHTTAEELFGAVAGDLGSVSRQAVFDSLAVLTEAGLIRRIQPSRSPARYETRVDDNHHHLVCRACGRVADTDCAVEEPPCIEASDDHGFAIDEAEVIFWGVCPACRESTATNT
jgi:Fur family ferric uptake transcriptional regulator